MLDVAQSRKGKGSKAPADLKNILRVEACVRIIDLLFLVEAQLRALCASVVLFIIRLNHGGTEEKNLCLVIVSSFEMHDFGRLREPVSVLSNYLAAQPR